MDLAIKLKPIAITLGLVMVKGDVSRAFTPWMKDFEQRRHREGDLLSNRSLRTMFNAPGSDCGVIAVWTKR